jgi:hypothetical protein
MKDDADAARQTSDSLMREFKKVDSDLQKAKDSLKYDQQGVGAFKIDSSK